MLKATEQKSVNSRKWARRLVFLFLITFIIVILSAKITVIANINHECIGDGCPICQVIHNSEMSLNEMTKIAISFCAVCTAFFTMIYVMVSAGVILDQLSTPIKLKVRLNI